MLKIIRRWLVHEIGSNFGIFVCFSYISVCWMFSVYYGVFCRMERGQKSVWGISEGGGQWLLD